MKTVAVIYMTDPLAFELLGTTSLAERCVRTLQEVRNIDEIVAAVSTDDVDVKDSLEAMGVTVKHGVQRQKAELPLLYDHHCRDAFAYCLEMNPRILVACVPYYPFLAASKIEMCVRRLGHYEWTGPSRCLPVTIPHPKGGTYRAEIDGYLGGLRAFKADLRNQAKPWDNKFGGVECDATEALNVAMPADYRLAKALVAG